MKKSSTKKKAIIMLVVLLLVGAIAAGIYAYFTDTESKTNTFTIGNVDIQLTEPLYDAAKQADADYGKNLMPGEEVVKDPTITNISTANSAYLFAKVTVPTYTASSTEVPLFSLENIGSGWELIQTTPATSSNHEVVYVYAYCNAAKTQMTSVAPNTAASVLFGKVKVSPTLDGTLASQVSGNQDVVVKALGIQTDGLTETTPTGIYGLFTNP